MRRPAWFAVRIDESTYAIVAAFPNEEGRRAHLDGAIVAALTQKAGHLLTGPPEVKPLDVLAAKLPT